MNIVEIPKISRTLFTRENYGIDQGIIWPVCHVFETDTYFPIDDWIVLGYCKDPEINSCAGGRRPFAIMYELQKKIEDKWGERDKEAGTKAWYHYTELPNFTTLTGE